MELVFIAGDSIQCMDVAITNTSTVEEDEHFAVTLTTLSSFVSLGNNVTRVMITDTDGMD